MFVNNFYSFLTMTRRYFQLYSYSVVFFRFKIFAYVGKFAKILFH